MTQSVDDVCKLSQMYVTPIKRNSSAALRGGESWIRTFTVMFLLGEQTLFVYPKITYLTEEKPDKYIVLLIYKVARIDDNILPRYINVNIDEQ